MTKKQIIKLLENQANGYFATGTKQDRERAFKTLDVLDVVERCKCNDYAVQYDNYNHINIGVLLESIVLNELNLLKEDNFHEIKSLVNNTPNILKNPNVKVVYIVVIKSSLKGVFECEAWEVFNKRLTLKEVKNLTTLKRNVCLSSALGL